MSTEPETTERPPVRVWRRLFLLTGGLIFFVIAFAAARWAYDRHLTANKLEALIARLDADDPGWKLDEIMAARAEPPEGQNSADVVVAVAKLVPGNWPYWETDPAYENKRFENLPIPELLDAERAKMLADEMAKMAPALAAARRLADMPAGKHKLEFGPNVWNTLLRDQQDTRRSAAMLRYDAWNLAQKGDTKGALLSARASINAGRSLGDEPTRISQLIRVACVAVGMNSVERTLALGEAADGDLAEVQKLLRLEGQHPTTLVVMRGERAMQHAMFDNIAKGRVSGAQAFGGVGGPGAGSWQDRLFGLSGLTGPRQHLLMLEFQTEMVDTARLPPHEQFAREAGIDKRVSALPRSDIFVKMLLPSVIKMNNAWRRTVGQVRAMDAMLAVERYRLKNGRWPDKLEDIPKEMLPSVPLDPYDGKPLRYKRTADGVVVYVFGEDRKDDGGVVARTATGDGPADWGYRLWDVNKRRQPPKPDENGPPGPGQ